VPRPTDGEGGAHPQARRAIVMGALLYPSSLGINAHRDRLADSLADSPHGGRAPQTGDAHRVHEHPCSVGWRACSFHEGGLGDEH